MLAAPRVRLAPGWTTQLPVARRLARPLSAQQNGKPGGRWGNENRLEPGQSNIESPWLPDSGQSYLSSIDGADDGATPLPEWRRALSEALGRLQYNYFNWRQDTWSDLQLFMVLNTLVFMLGAWVEDAVIRNMDDSVPAPPEGSGPLVTAWYNLYKVLSVVLGQDLPDDQAGLPSQLFAILTAVFGLASFALVLALIEQVVLEVLESNVKRGSMCYESRHTVVLAWCESSRDIAQLTRILTQLCAANRASGGGVVVVLTQQRGKLEMEQLFREVVPDRQRYGTRFVFRQGSPLDPSALRMVAATEARSIIVCGDNSKRAKDADAQVLRACVLLDENIQQVHMTYATGPVVVAQIKTEDALPLVAYSCSRRVIPVPTTKLNARRYVRLLHHPIAAVFSRCLSDFYSPAHGSIDRCPEVEGETFAQLHFRFPDAVVLGLANKRNRTYLLNPAPDTVVQQGDDVIVMRPERWAPGSYRALPQAVAVDPGAWNPDMYVLRSRDEQPLGLNVGGMDSCAVISARSQGESKAADAPARPARRGGGKRPKRPRLAGSSLSEPYQSSLQGLYVLPVQYSNSLLAANELLICGWMGQTFMWELMAELDHSDQGLPPGSRVTLFNEHKWTAEYLKERCQQYRIHNLEVVHVQGDPRSRCDMQRLLGGVSRFLAAIVVCDSIWADANSLDPDSGLQLLSQAEMLSLDSAMLMVQLNIRMMLEEAGHPNINIICEKLTYVGVTRFEDDARLPLGIAVNSASFAAKSLTQVAVEPRYLHAYMTLGQESDLMVQDASAFAAEGEELSFLQLQARAASVRQIILGWYRIPAAASQPLEMVVNPQGLEERSKVVAWNQGDSRCKLVTVAPVKAAVAAAEAASGMPWPFNASVQATLADEQAAAAAGVSSTSDAAAAASGAAD